MSAYICSPGASHRYRFWLTIYSAFGNVVDGNKHITSLLQMTFYYRNRMTGSKFRGIRGRKKRLFLFYSSVNCQGENHIPTLHHVATGAWVASGSRELCPAPAWTLSPPEAFPGQAYLAVCAPLSSSELTPTSPTSSAAAQAACSSFLLSCLHFFLLRFFFFTELGVKTVSDSKMCEMSELWDFLSSDFTKRVSISLKNWSSVGIGEVAR